ncbi:MAG: YraN family protein [Bacteroidetes bacterium]|nr:YraN family protein [Bacteroidota bacterium]
MPNNTEKGTRGEEIAVAYLLKHGYQIIEKNWRHSHLEIDIIASINDTLVIVEVKLRTNDFFGNPEEFVTKNKQKKVIKAADVYIKENNINWETRFDIIAIIQNPQELKVEHFIGAFYPTL